MKSHSLENTNETERDAKFWRTYYSRRKRMKKEELNRRMFNKNMKRVAIIGCVSVLGIFGFKLKDNYLLKSRGKEVRAVVLYVKKGKYMALGLDGGETFNHYLIVTFSNNDQQEVKAVLELTPDEYQLNFRDGLNVGDTIQIVYSPSNPQIVELLK